MPFFSIIIPTYNRAHLIEETIKSVLIQSFQDWECIVVDDGSKDNTKEVILSLSKIDNRIKYVYQENAERSTARNNGICNSKGKYICFLDSDDSFDSNHLEILFSAIENSKVKEVLFFTGYKIKTLNNSTNVEIETYKENLIHYLCYNPIIPARVCCHRKILEEFSFDEDIVVVEDLILWLKIAQKYPFVQLEERTINYHMHEDNSVNIANNGYQLRLKGLFTFKARYKFIWKRINRIDRNFLIGNTYFGIAKHHVYHKNRVKAIFYLMYSICYQKIHKQLKHKIWLIIRILKNNLKFD